MVGTLTRSADHHNLQHSSISGAYQPISRTYRKMVRSPQGARDGRACGRAVGPSATPKPILQPRPTGSLRGVCMVWHVAGRRRPPYTREGPSSSVGRHASQENAVDPRSPATDGPADPGPPRDRSAATQVSPTCHTGLQIHGLRFSLLRKPRATLDPFPLACDRRHTLLNHPLTDPLADCILRCGPRGHSERVQCQ